MTVYVLWTWRPSHNDWHMRGLYCSSEIAEQVATELYRGEPLYRCPDYRIEPAEIRGAS